MSFQNQFVKTFKGLDQAIAQGTARAMNRALSTTQTQLAKNLKDDTGLSTKVIKSRMLSIPATKGKLAAVLAIAVKVGVSLAEFAPQIKKVKVVHQGNTKATTHYGVTVKIGGTRTLVPGAWLAYAKNGKALVLSRKAGNRYPTVALRTDAFRDAVVAREPDAQKVMLDKFNEIVSTEIDNSIQYKFNSDR